MIRCENVSRIFRTTRGDVKALDGLDLEVAQGRFVVVRGASGSGKTTLLLGMGGMLRPTRGTICVNGQDVYGLSLRARAEFRACTIGFVFQMFHLVPYLSVIENVLVPAGAGIVRADRGKARKLLERFGLGHRADHHPGQLSAGERQRTAMARALYVEPRVILADEPTGNLDPDNAADLMRHLAQFRDEGGTVVVVTHGHSADPHADQVIPMDDGRIQEPAAV